jgi:hypothetical protein
MRLRYLALAVVLIVVLNAAITYGIVQWASPSGAQGSQGVQGIPGPVATADANSAACAAVLQGGIPSTADGYAGLQRYNSLVTKYCP